MSQNFYMKLAKKGSLVLFLGYAIGQGSTLLLQLISKYLEFDELTGFFVLIISLFSFCFQFSDMGNSTFLVKNIIIRNYKTVESFIYIRSLVSFFICLLFGIYVYFLNSKVEGLFPFVVVMPILGAILGQLRLAYSESVADYLHMSFVNLIGWVSLSLLLSLYMFLPSSAYDLLNWIIAFVLCLCALLIRLKSIKHRKTLLLTKSSVIDFSLYPRVFQFLLPQIGGQVWGRTILLIIANQSGLISLGILGIAKYGQVFLTLLLSFITRPILRSYISDKTEQKISFSLISLLFYYRKAFILSLLGPLSFIIMRNYFGGVFLGWEILFCITPFTLLSQACVQVNQLTLSAKHQISIDFFGLLLNISVFFLIFDNNIINAVFFGELTQCIANFIICILINFIRK